MVGEGAEGGEGSLFEYYEWDKEAWHPTNVIYHVPSDKCKLKEGSVCYEL